MSNVIADNVKPPYFFEVSERDGALVVNFMTKNDCATGAGVRVNVLPAQYEEFRALSARFKGRMVVATGPGPVEGYFALGYYAALAGASCVVYEGPFCKPRYVMPMRQSEPREKPWFHIEPVDGGSRIVIVKSGASDGKWSDAEIGYSELSRIPSLPGDLTITGAGAVSMYLHLGVSAAYAGRSDVRILKPTVPYAIRFSPTCAGETIPVVGEKRGVVIGAIGDPNSGKSVFSRVFYMALRQMMPNWFKSWIYDCDFACPTPDWYCSALVDADRATECEYKALRKSQKVLWTPELESRCAQDLGVLRTNLDLVIADLPGGLHKDDQRRPLERPIRVGTESRAEMLRPCDAFVLICRADRRDAILKGWVDSLAEFGLENRLLAVLDSSEPNSAFSCSTLVPDDTGVFHAEIRGLDRTLNVGEAGYAFAESVRPLVRALTAIPVVNAARAATATAFLTGDKGTRYGAAVRSASTGRIFAAGQYSSFNHSTNMHAEMNALSQAAMAGEPDVDLLAIASTSPAEASPCGVCRQVLIEHATRTKRDFDVALTTPGRHPVIVSVSDLLPRAWKAPTSATSTDVRDYPQVEEVFDEGSAPHTGSELIVPPQQYGEPRRIALVWDATFTPCTAIFKFKYEETSEGRWRKLPHAFADSSAYLRYLNDQPCGSRAFTGLVQRRLSANDRFKHPIPLPGDQLRFFRECLFAPVGIDATTSVSVTCSRMTGLATEKSDWDLCVVATPEQVAALRARVTTLANEGRVTFPDKSQGWKRIKDSFPGATADGGARIHAELRYADSFCLNGIPVSFLFVPPKNEAPEFAFPDPFVTVGRTAITGRVVDAARAPYKRSASVIETDDHHRLRLLCYHKLGNLLKNGDRISATGVLCRHGVGEKVMDCSETLVLSAPAIDRLVWQP